MYIDSSNCSISEFQILALYGKNLNTLVPGSRSQGIELATHNLRLGKRAKIAAVLLPMLALVGGVIAYSLVAYTSSGPRATQVYPWMYSEQIQALDTLVKQHWITKHYGLVLDTGPAGSFDEKIASNPSVVRDGPYTYRLYYTARDASGKWTIGMATSKDGLVWKKHPTPVITPEMVQDAGYDVTGVWQPSIVINNTGYYHLFFAADLMQPWGRRRDTIFLAVSTDGETFTIIGPVLHPIRLSMEGRVWQPCVVWYDWAGAWLMYYVGTDDRVSPGRPRVFVAQSYNLYTWERVGMALQHTEGEWDLRVRGVGAVTIGEMVMLCYSGEYPLLSRVMTLGLAFSLDGITFMRSYRNPVLLRALEGEKRRISDNSIIWEGGKLQVWYDGFDGEKVRIFYAELLPSDVDIRQVFIHRHVRWPNVLVSDWINGRYDTIRIYFHANWTGWVWIEIWDEENQVYLESWNFEYYESVYLGYKYRYYRPCKQEIYTLELAPLRSFRIVFVPDPGYVAQTSAWVVLS